MSGFDSGKVEASASTGPEPQPEAEIPTESAEQDASSEAVRKRSSKISTQEAPRKIPAASRGAVAEVDLDETPLDRAVWRHLAEVVVNERPLHHAGRRRLGQVKARLCTTYSRKTCRSVLHLFMVSGEAGEDTGRRGAFLQSIYKRCVLQAIPIRFGSGAADQEFQRLAPQYEEEICRMKDTKVGGGGASYYDVATRDKRRLVAWLAHGAARSELLREGFEGRFPHYGLLIARRVAEAWKRKDLQDWCLPLLSRQLPLLPLMMIEHVLSFLEESDMQHLIDAFTGTT